MKRAWRKYAWGIIAFLVLFVAVTIAVLLSRDGNSSCPNGYEVNGDFSRSEFAFICTMRADNSPFKSKPIDDKDLIVVADNTCDLLDYYHGNANRALFVLISEDVPDREAGWLIGAAAGYCSS